MHLSLQSGARNRETAAENWISKGRCVAFQLSQIETCMLHDACFQWSFLSQREEFMAFSYLFFHVRRLFHSISLHGRSGRIVSTFNNCDTSTTWSYISIYRDVYCQASNEEVNMRPCAIFPKISWTPELPTRKQHDFRWFLPHPNMENQPISHSAINTWHMVNSEIGVGQLAWILGQATNILKQESLDATGWIIHQNCIWRISECCLMHLLNCLLYISDLLTYVLFIDSEHSKHCQL